LFRWSFRNAKFLAEAPNAPGGGETNVTPLLFNSAAKMGQRPWAPPEVVFKLI